MSPSDIANETQLTLPMASSLTKELADEGYIVVAEVQNSKVGRPATLYQLNPTGGYTLGITLGARKSRMILLNLKEEELDFIEYASVDLNDEENTINTLSNRIDELISKNEIPRDKILGVGFAISGLVNAKSGKSLTYFKDSTSSLQELLQEKLGFEVALENNVNAVTLGEKYFGKAKETEDAGCIHLDWGIGMGLILGGELYGGHSGLAGEIGHIRVVEGGDICSCGKIGCLETVASGRGLINKAVRLLKEGRPSIIAKKYHGDFDQIVLEDLLDAVQRGDQFSLELVEEAGKYIGKSIGTLINLLNLEKVILSGKLSQMGDALLYPIRSAIMHSSLTEMKDDVDIVISDIDVRAGCLGATTLITKKIFESVNIDADLYV
ncbi:ROK family protein [Persicobacter psychrovividus]|uniref:ROK family transcriptional regulator n=1 Tax=Persicobacter psychrovividus TaxID=387638 RepID=UPI002FCDF879